MFPYERMTSAELDTPRKGVENEGGVGEAYLILMLYVFQNKNSLMSGIVHSLSKIKSSPPFLCTKKGLYFVLNF